LREDESLPDLDIPDDAPPGDHLYGIIQRGDNHLLMHAPQAALGAGDAAQMTLTLRLHDAPDRREAEGFRETWRRFLLLSNLYQFLPGFASVTTEYARQFVPQEIGVEIEREIEIEGSVPAEWAEAVEYAPECGELLRACIEAATSPPVVGYELLDNAGRIGGSAELAWEERQVAVFLPDQADDVAAFAGVGWKTYNLEQVDAILRALTA